MGKILKIYTVEDKKEEKFLRELSKEVSLEEIKSDEFQTFLDDLLFTAQNVTTQEGYIAAGLAAVQVGKHYNMFCILEEDSRDFYTMINPKIEILNTLQSSEKEGCLSIPGVEKPVRRFKKIRVTYLDRQGKKNRKVFTEYEAREIQHEYDHTQGILFTDRI